MKQVSTILKRAFFNLWHTPSARVLATQELEEARRQYLRNQTLAEYHAQMNLMYKNTIARLEKYLREEQ